MPSKQTIILIVTFSLILVIVYSSNNASIPTEPTEVPSSISQKNEETHIEQVTYIATELETETVSSGNLITETPQVFTADSLAKYNGEDSSLPIYVAFDGNVYDVTEGKKFYGPDGHYNFLAGTDGTKLLRFFGGSIIEKKYPVVGTFSP